MDNSINKIVEEFYTSKETKEMFSKIPFKWRNDLLTHISIILMEMDSNKLIGIYNRGELYRFVGGIIQIQFWKGKKKKKNKPQSSFWKQYSLVDNGDILDDGSIIDPNIIDLTDDINMNDIELLNIIDNELGEILDAFYYKNKDSINYFFNRQVFELYYYDKMTMTEISKRTRIRYETIRDSIRFTFSFLREELIERSKK